LKGSISVKGRAITSAGVSRSATAKELDADKVKGLSHHGHPQLTILSKCCQHDFLLLNIGLFERQIIFSHRQLLYK
jgi:hypothetical protein